MYSFTRVEWQRSEAQDEEPPAGLFRKPGWQQHHRNSGTIVPNTDDPDTDQKRLLWKRRNGPSLLFLSSVTLMQARSSTPWQYPVVIYL